MKEILAEKYRPSTINEYLFQNEKIEQVVKRWVADKSIPNVMMVSDAGQGKTTLARILKNELGISDCDFKVIKCSSDTGIATIRDELEPWLKKAPLGKSFKIVHLEEMDRLSKQAFDALKQPTEEFSSYVRFIATANNISRIPKPLMSRFTMLDMNGIDCSLLIDRVVDIIDQEGIMPKDDDVEIILSHVNTYYPDLRKILNSIEECTTYEPNNGFKILSMPMTTNSSTADLEKWQTICEAPSIDPMDLLELSHLSDDANYEFFYQCLYNNHHHYENIATSMVKIAKYLDMAQRTANQNITLDACIYELFFIEE
ncbi:replication factor C small subunit [Alishewanella phage vB_AspM_Slickus01]|nr:replication factor C small subunit [Alishewanella phage vB_AspM_Slicko01]WGH49828.1 replication factor C small subunit [Alishewanella phage vB_AspM_Slickus01]